MMQKVGMTSFRIIVLGAQEVGKSALTVRFLTQRFIGEYSSQKDLLYCSHAQVDSTPVDLEILDTSRDQTDCIPQEKVHWADGYAVVYSISSRSSFLVAADCLRHLNHLTSCSSTPVILLANKRDLEHCREVSTQEGERLASDFSCTAFAEVSAAEGVHDVSSAFQSLLREIREVKAAASSTTSSSPKRKISVVSVSKIISAVFGRNPTTIGEHQQTHRQKKRPSLSL